MQSPLTNRTRVPAPLPPKRTRNGPPRSHSLPASPPCLQSQPPLSHPTSGGTLNHPALTIPCAVSNPPLTLPPRTAQSLTLPCKCTHTSLIVALPLMLLPSFPYLPHPFTLPSTLAHLVSTPPRTSTHPSPGSTHDNAQYAQAHSLQVLAFEGADPQIALDDGFEAAGSVASDEPSTLIQVQSHSLGLSALVPSHPTALPSPSSSLSLPHAIASLPPTTTLRGGTDVTEGRLYKV